MITPEQLQQWKELCEKAMPGSNFIAAAREAVPKLIEEIELFHTDQHPEYSVIPRCHHENDKEIYVEQIKEIARLREELNGLKIAYKMLGDKG